MRSISILLLFCITTGAKSERAQKKDDTVLDKTIHGPAEVHGSSESMAELDSVSVLKEGVDVGVNVSNGYTMEWSWSCWHLKNRKILSASTYCYDGANWPGAHCFDVVDLDENYAAMLELYNTKGGHPKVSCHSLGNSGYNSTRLYTVSSLEYKGANKKAWADQPKKKARQCIAGWKDKGYTSECIAKQATMAGLQKWVTYYLKKFPKYDTFTNNCQKFCAALYNSVTHSKTSERQRGLIDTLKTGAGLLMG